MDNNSSQIPPSGSLHGQGGRSILPARPIELRAAEQLLSTPSPMCIPIHERFLDINQQTASPLYNGVIPPEIRDQIFSYALTEYTKPDPSSQYHRSTNYTRPGYTGLRAVTIGLLLTCRRVYQETYHLPATSKEHVFWHERGPPNAVVEDRYFKELMKPWQSKLVREIHLFAQMYWLELSFANLCKSNFMQGIEKVKITIRRGDWWYNETNEPLGICPQSGSAQGGNMLREWAAEKRGKITPWKPRAWGCALAKLAALRELEMELETSEDKIGELKAIVEKAKGWRFPLENGKVLSADGMDVKVSEWQSDKNYWSEVCPYCQGGQQCRSLPLSEQKEGCRERARSKAEGKGPMCTVMSLRWRVVTKDDHEGR